MQCSREKPHEAGEVLCCVTAGMEDQEDQVDRSTGFYIYPERRVKNGEGEISSGYTLGILNQV
ncbi:unnamed protein product [Prunus armeniaca]